MRVGISDKRQNHLKSTIGIFFSVMLVGIFICSKKTFAADSDNAYNMILIDNQKQEVVFQRGNTDAVYRPSSTFKCVTAAALLENGADVNEKLDTSQYILGKSKVPSSATEPDLKERLDMGECVVRNLISVWGREADKLADSAYEQTLQKFGFSVNQEDAQQTLTKIAIGQDMEVTVQQMADFYMAVYNQGVCWRTQKNLMQEETAFQVKKWIENSNENPENKQRANFLDASISGYWGSMVSENRAQIYHSFIGTFNKNGTEYGLIINQNTAADEEVSKVKLMDSIRKIIDEL